MKAIVQKFISFSMVILLLASTTSWKVEKHFCMGHLVDMAFFLDAEDCDMSSELINDGESGIQDEISCCSDDVIYIAGQDDLTFSFDTFDIGQQSFMIAKVQSFIALFSASTVHPVPYEHYPPPILVKNLQLLDQVFLI